MIPGWNEQRFPLGAVPDRLAPLGIQELQNFTQIAVDDLQVALYSLPRAIRTQLLSSSFAEVPGQLVV